MTTPPGLLGAALVFWGWQTGLVPVGLTVALLLEGMRALPRRWELDRADFHRVADLCRVILLAEAAYLFTTRPAPQAVWGVVEWYPLTLLPLVLCQALAPGPKIDLFAFLLIVRRGRTVPDGGAVELAYPYLVVCVLAAGAGNVRTPAFYAAVVGLAAWGLATVRPPRVPCFRWGALLALVGAAGYGGQLGLHRLQILLEATLLDLVFADRADRDLFHAATAIGEIGRLKVSGRILLRVALEGGVTPPVLLREASYDVYASPVWAASATRLGAIHPDAHGLTWRFGPPAGATGPGLRVWRYLRQGRGLLALPTGAAEVQRLSALAVRRNALGAVAVEEGSGSPATAWSAARARRWTLRPAPPTCGCPRARRRSWRGSSRTWASRASRLRRASGRWPGTSGRASPTPPPWEPPGPGPRRSRTSFSGAARGTASTSPPPPCCCCARRASRPATRSATRWSSRIPWRAATWCGRATPTPGPWCTGTAGGATWTPPRPRGSVPRRRTPPPGRRSTTSPPGCSSPSPGGAGARLRAAGSASWPGCCSPSGSSWPRASGSAGGAAPRPPRLCSGAPPGSRRGLRVLRHRALARDAGVPARARRAPRRLGATGRGHRGRDSRRAAGAAGRAALQLPIRPAGARTGRAGGAPDRRRGVARGRGVVAGRGPSQRAGGAAGARRCRASPSPGARRAAAGAGRGARLTAARGLPIVGRDHTDHGARAGVPRRAPSGAVRHTRSLP